MICNDGDAANVAEALCLTVSSEFFIGTTSPRGNEYHAGFCFLIEQDFGSGSCQINRELPLVAYSGFIPYVLHLHFRNSHDLIENVLLLSLTAIQDFKHSNILNAMSSMSEALKTSFRGYLQRNYWDLILSLAGTKYYFHIATSLLRHKILNLSLWFQKIQFQSNLVVLYA
ncbi:hypothetical protein PUG81_17280 [Erwiniaceae bacterium L1_54_6]|jgi:hypothetical protein|nr:hypothetical protein [Erwiniaceae bacterium L1_54_6]